MSTLLVPRPTADECRALRKALGLSLDDMAALAGLAHRQRWIEYEAGEGQPDIYRWTILMLMLDLHPTMKLVEKEGTPEGAPEDEGSR